MSDNELSPMPDWAPTAAPAWTADRLIRAIGDTDAVAIDLYKTVARTHYKEPIKNLQDDILALQGLADDKGFEQRFLRACLTTPYMNTDQYLDDLAQRFSKEVAERFPGTGIPRDVRESFRRLVERERYTLLAYTDVRAKLQSLHANRVLALVTNSWPFPVTKFLLETGLRALFDHLVISAELGVAKQDGAEIYRITAMRLGMPPSRICMIGDNPELDILPALAAGMKVILCDRSCEYIDEDGKWVHEELARRYPGLPMLQLPVIRDFNQIPDPTR